MNSQELQSQKFRHELAANSLSQIEIAQKMLQRDPNHPEWILLHSQAVEQYEGLMKSIFANQLAEA